MAALVVLLVLAAVIVGWVGFEWLSAGRTKRRLAAGQQVANLGLDSEAAVRNFKSDPEVNRGVVRPPMSGPGASG